MALTVTLGPVASARLRNLPRAALPDAIDAGLAAQSRTGFGTGLALGAALALGSLAAAPLHAATITVNTSAIDQTAGDSFCDLYEALDNANTNLDNSSGDCAAGDPGLDTIVFDANLGSSSIALDGTLLVDDELVLDGSDVLALDGNGSYQIIKSYAPLTVRNIVLTNGYSDAGGAIYAKDDLTIENAAFYGNDSYFPGGAVLAEAGLTVSNSDFILNQAYYVGGGAVASFGDSSSFSNVYAYGNSTGYGVGGALLLAQGSHTVTGGVFAYNDAASGGAIAAGRVYSGGGGERKGLSLGQPLSLSIVGGEFLSNQATGGRSGQINQSAKLPTGGSSAVGGAVAFVAPQYDTGLAHSLSITGGTSFQRNGALQGAFVPAAKLPSPGEGTGGAVFAASTGAQPGFAKGVVDDTVDVLVEDADFVNNVALIGGGAMLQGTTVTVRGSTFESNLGLLFGGGLIAGNKYQEPGDRPSDAVTLQDSDLLGNGAYAFGGGMLFGYEASVSGVEARGNGAKYLGAPAEAGARKGSTIDTAVDCEFGRNDAVAGLGVLGIYSASVSGGSIFAGNCGNGFGGGLLASSYGGTISVAGDTRVYGNSAEVGAGLYLGAKYETSATVGGRFEGNAAVYAGGGILVYAEDGSTVAFTDITVAGNSAPDGAGGGLFLAGTTEYGPSGPPSVVLSGSTISGNSAATGGGIFTEGRGNVINAKQERKGMLRALAAEWGFGAKRPQPVGAAKGSSPILFDVDIVNSTIDGNSSVAPAAPPPPRAKGFSFPGMGSGGGITNDGANLDLAFVTVSGNSAESQGGGLFGTAFGGGEDAVIRNSVFAENSAASGDDVGANVIADFSLFGDATFVPLSGANNQIGVNAQLGALQDNGGPTFTRLPAGTSPAIDSADPAFAPPPEFDQRGAGFPRVVGGIADKGAVELPPPQVVSLVIDPDSFLENAGSTMTVTLDRAPGVDVPVTVAFSGTAVLDTDFASGDDDGVAAGVQVVVPAGNASGSVALTGLDDAVDEPDEPFTATVTGAVGADLPAGAVSDVGTVLDNDAATLSIGDVTVAEEDGSAVFAVDLSIPSASTVEVAFTSADGSATAPADYTAVNGTLTFNPGDTSGQIVVPIIDDTLAEPDETFSVTLSAPVNATISDASGTGTILDTDVAPTVGVGLSIGNVDEDGGTTQIIATLSSSSSQPVVITLQFGGDATFGVDYTVEDQDPGTPGIQIVIPPGATSGSVLLTAIGDQPDENDEQVIVTIASASGGVGVDPTPAAGTIIDPASAPPPLPQPTVVPTLSPWLLLLLGLVLPATVMRRLRGE